MVVNAIYNEDNKNFTTDEDAQDIASSFLNGNTVVVALDCDGWNYIDDPRYIQMLGYSPADDQHYETFLFSNCFGYTGDGFPEVIGSVVGPNGKLIFETEAEEY